MVSFKSEIFLLIAETVFLLFSVTMPAQTVNKIDSLKNIINHAASDTDKIKCLESLSEIYTCSDSTEKLNAAKEALRLAENIHWISGVTDANIIIGRYYGECKNDFTEAIKYFSAVVSVAKNCSDVYRHAVSLEYIAQSYIKMGQYGNALSYYRKMLSLPVKDELRLGAFSNIGGIYSELGIYKTSLDYYDSAFQILNKIPEAQKKDCLRESRAWLEITTADIYLVSKEYDHALLNYMDAWEICVQTKNDPGIILALTGIVKVYQALGNNEKTIEYCAKLLEQCRKESSKEEDKNSELISYNQLAAVYLKKGMTDKAYEYAQKSLRLIKSCPENIQVPVTYNVLGEINTRLKRYDKATFYFEKAISFCQKSGALENEKGALLGLSTVYQQMNQPAKALDVYKNYIAVRDSLYNIDKAKEITKYMLTADFKEKQAVQEKENAIMQLTIRRQRLVYVALTLIIFLLLLVGLLLFNRARLRRKLETQIAIAGERNRISAEMHDDLGSQLSKISLLSEIVKDNAAGQGAQMHLENISKSSRELLDKMGEIVWSLNNKYDTLESLIIYIRRYAMEYFSATDITCKVEIPELVPDIIIEGELRRNIFLIVKEALHNVLKHSHGNLVVVSITIDARSININVQDNGVGIDAAAISALGNGLHNMKKRTEDVKGTLVIKIGQGAILEFKFPLSGSAACP